MNRRDPDQYDNITIQIIAKRRTGDRRDQSSANAIAGVPGLGIRDAFPAFRLLCICLGLFSCFLVFFCRLCPRALRRAVVLQ